MNLFRKLSVSNNYHRIRPLSRSFSTDYKTLYTAHASSTGGRVGSVVSDDGLINFHLAKPKGLGGNGLNEKGVAGTNPEQLFAAGYSACFIGALNAAGGRLSISVPPSTTVSSAVSIGKVSDGLSLALSITVRAPGLSKSDLDKLIETAHTICPYSRAVKGNVQITSVGLTD